MAETNLLPEQLGNLAVLLSAEPVVAIIGETAVVDALTAGLTSSLNGQVIVLDSLATPSALYESLAQGLGNDSGQHNDAAVAAAVSRRIASLDRDLYLICKRAEIYPKEVLEQCRQLANLGAVEQRHIGVLLTGGTALADRLTRKDMRGLAQRVGTILQVENGLLRPYRRRRGLLRLATAAGAAAAIGGGLFHWLMPLGEHGQPGATANQIRQGDIHSVSSATTSPDATSQQQAPFGPQLKLRMANDLGHTFPSEQEAAGGKGQNRRAPAAAPAR